MIDVVAVGMTHRRTPGVCLNPSSDTVRGYDDIELDRFHSLSWMLNVDQISDSQETTKEDQDTAEGNLALKAGL